MFLYHCLCAKKQDRTEHQIWMHVPVSLFMCVMKQDRTENQIWMHVPVSLFMCNETGQDRTSDMNACSCIIVYVLRNRTEHQIWMHVPVSLFMCNETGQNIRYECMFLYHCLCVKKQDRTSDMNACSCIIVYVLRNRTEHQIWMHVPISLFMC